VLLHLTLTNYLANLRRLGYTDTDLTAPGSDRIVDDLIPQILKMAGGACVMPLPSLPAFPQARGLGSLLVLCGRYWI
jgi:hypothetical protein